MRDAGVTRARRAATLAAVLLLGAVPLGAGTDADFQEAVATIRCDCGCHPQSVEACSCGRAAAMREEIAAMIRGTGGGQPMTAADVIARYVAEQGEQIRIAPSTAGFSLLAWLGPLIALVLGMFGAVFLVRRLARGGREAQATAEIPAPETGVLDEDSAYRARLQRQLDDWS